VSAVTDRLSEDDFRELARLIRTIHADVEKARREREQREATSDQPPPTARNGAA
jgi:cytochrome c553